MVRADLRGLRWLVVALPLLIAVAVALGVAVAAQERGLRRSSARAADDFALLVGAPGSETQLVLTTVYLDLAALPLLDGAVVNTLAADPRVAGVAPVAFGDVVRGFPVVGTTAAFATRWGRMSTTEGRLFEREGEALLGSDVGLRLGESVTPSHVAAAGPPQLRGDHEDESRHRHEGAVYMVVGRLPRTGTPWDRAILVPIESVWATHGLGSGHPADRPVLGPPFDGPVVPGVPAIVVKPRRIVDSYSLRADYRRGGASMALFPAEVLVSLYRTIGDVRDVLVAVSVATNGLVLVSILILLLTLIGLRRQRYGLLRALGAPARYVFVVVWLQAVLLLGAGCAIGLLGGWGAALLVSDAIERRIGLQLAFAPGAEDALYALGIAALGSLFALVPAAVAHRVPVNVALRP